MVICTYFYDLMQPASWVLCIKLNAIPCDVLYSNLIHDYFGRLLYFMLWLLTFLLRVLTVYFICVP